MSPKSIIIGTRGSELALWQAHHIEQRLISAGHTVEIKIIKTKGDKIQHLSFDKIEGKGFFTKELQDALLAEEIDMAVHSHKDLETTQPDGLTIAAVTSREEPNEVLLIKSASHHPQETLELPPNAVVGTSSIRRKMILGHVRPDLHFEDLRGNVPTRIQKLRDNNWDAIVLAKAGLNRIAPDLSGIHAITLDATSFVPAPAQGALALECRTNDLVMREILALLHDEQTATAVEIERSILRGIGGGCQVPLASHAFNHAGTWQVHTSFTNSLDQAMQRIVVSGDLPEQLVQQTLAKLQIERQ
jgi:hydroxymethylbilane synthase